MTEADAQPMPNKFHWPSFIIAMAAGIVVGVLVTLAAVRLGMPKSWVGPVTGGLVGALTPFFYGLRSREE